LYTAAKFIASESECVSRLYQSYHRDFIVYSNFGLYQWQCRLLQFNGNPAFG